MTAPMMVLKNTESLCPMCLARIPATVVLRDGSVWMEKRCPEHADFSVQLASDPRHYRVARADVEALGSCCGPGRHCGDQLSNHSCNMLIELTQQCNLTCPTCYAGSSPTNTEFLAFNDFKAMIDGLIEAGKGDADLIQLSGGEPTIHPRLTDCIDYALTAGIKQIYINTNGIKLANRAFAEKIATFGERVSIYLQFDGFEADTYRKLRGDDDLLVKKERAIQHCEDLGITVVPIVTLTAGINDHEIGDILEMASRSPRAIRKVMIHPAMYSGRYQNPKRVERADTGAVIRAICEQTGVFIPEDFGPIPCSDPQCFNLAVALRTSSGLVPISRYFPRYDTWSDPDNAALITSVTDTFDTVTDLQSVLGWVASSGALQTLGDDALDALLDELEAAEAGWGGLFVIGIKPFMDAWTYDQDRIDKCCVHIISRDGTPVSFCEYNAIWRPGGRQ